MNHITSPNAADDTIEAAIVAKGKTAPRITPTDIEAAIAGEFSFTVGNAARALNCPVSEAVDLLTICVLTLKNGFTVTGESACASPENFDAQIGYRIARENAKQKVWPLLGYLLKENLSKSEPDTAAP
ncbi:MAG: Gp49 family protein [Burkholderiaceae bacterium]